MPVLSIIDYKPPPIFRIGNVNTMYPYFFRKKIIPPYKRERFLTSDGDFVDIDFLKDGNEKLVILCHGLEGNTGSQYMQNTSLHLNENGWDVAGVNFRSCSGEMNWKLPMYHSGFTNDLHEIVEKYSASYNSIALVGVSLGGNVILKYTTDGIFELSPKIKAVVGISVPTDLSKSSQTISKFSNWLYDKRFRISLEKKIREKHELFPEDINIEDLKKIKSLRDFDEFFTGPIHGFGGAEDYYSKCNSKQFLHNASIPSLMIAALDDPFLPKECYPFEIAHESDNLFFMAPKFGGHVGFTTFGSNTYWNEQKILQFINNPMLFGEKHRAASN